jgi:LAS superfamily LD-carboxypeptidase LdcB
LYAFLITALDYKIFINFIRYIVYKARENMSINNINYLIFSGRRKENNMDIFSRHELVKTEDGYTLVLFLEQQTSEFGEEFLSSLTDKSRKFQVDSLDYIRKIINNNYKDVKIDTVKIMLGSLLIASMGYNTVQVAALNANPIPYQTQVKSNVAYTVKPGDTLYNIAKKTGTSIVQLMKVNNLSSNLIFPGQQLYIQESIKPPETTKPQESQGSYTVRSGDTLYSVSRKFNISVARLKEINRIAGDTIYPGQKLNIISLSTPAAPTASNILLVNKKHALPSNYIPSNLINPNVPSADRSKTRMTPEAAKALEALFAQAKKDNIQLTAISGYRSYARQDEIFSSNVRKYGSVAAANQFSARPGESEHQTGLAMDVSSPSVGNNLTQAYANTREGKWLKENAPKFGFIVRYEKGKEQITGYQFEPWHLRYVGKDASTNIAYRNIVLEEYLGRV